MAGSDRRDRSMGAMRVIITIVLLVVLVRFVDAETIVATALSADGFWIAIALALLPLNLFLEAIKWRLLVRHAGATSSIRQALGSVLAGYTLGFVTPFRVGDYAGRVLYLDHTEKGSLLVLSGLDRLYSIWVYALAGSLALAYLLMGSAYDLGGAWWLTLGVGLGATLAISVLLVRPSLMYVVSNSLLRWRKGRALQRHFVAASRVSPVTGCAVLILSLIRFCVFSSQFVLLLLAFAPATSIPALYVGVVLVFFAKTIIPSISVFDLGIRESASIFFLGLFAVPAVVAFNASVLLFAVNLALPALAGVLFVPRIGWTKAVRSSRKHFGLGTKTG